jgi:hypothetical protein
MPDEAELVFDRAYAEWLQASAGYECSTRAVNEAKTEDEIEVLNAQASDRLIDAERQLVLLPVSAGLRFKQKFACLRE